MNRAKVYEEHFGKPLPKPYTIQGFDKSFDFSNAGKTPPTIRLKNIPNEITDIFETSLQSFVQQTSEGLQYALSGIEIELEGIQKREKFPNEKNSCRSFWTPRTNHEIHIYLGNEKNKPSIRDIDPMGAMSILIHELVHSRTYQYRSKKDVTKIGMAYIELLIKKTLGLPESGKGLATIEPYEKHIDRQVIGLGHGKGLQIYQDYLIPMLNEHEKKKRQFLYYTNQEIQAFMEKVEKNQ